MYRNFSTSPYTLCKRDRWPASSEDRYCEGSRTPAMTRSPICISFPGYFSPLWNSISLWYHSLQQHCSSSLCFGNDVPDSSRHLAKMHECVSGFAGISAASGYNKPHLEDPILLPRFSHVRHREQNVHAIPGNAALVHSESSAKVVKRAKAHF